MLSAFNIYLLRSYFKSVPSAIIESAKIDGANEFTIFFRLALPLCKTGIVTVTLLLMLTYWNDWFQSMLYINTDKYVSLQYLLYKMLNRVEFMTEGAGAAMFNQGQVPTESIRMATCIIAAGPMLLVFPFFQKYFVGGISLGAVKE